MGQQFLHTDRDLDNFASCKRCIRRESKSFSSFLPNFEVFFDLSGLSRDVEEARSVFEENDGFSVLIRAMQSEVKKLQVKAVFMLTAMCNAHPAYKGQ